MEDVTSLRGYWRVGGYGGAVKLHDYVVYTVSKCVGEVRLLAS